MSDLLLDTALRAALAAGEAIERVYADGFAVTQKLDLTPVTEADVAAERIIVEMLRAEFPEIPVISEEMAAIDQLPPLSGRFWIVDPLDGTREFSEPPRDDWAVHVALWQSGELVAGAVAQPGLGTTFHTGAPPVVPPRPAEQILGRPRIAASRTRPPAFVHALLEHLGGELVPMGSAGAKVISVVRDVSDAYLHSGGQYEWDSAAPVAVARAAGLHTSRVDGSPLVYNQDDVLLPDLLVCRPELTEPILDFLREHGTD